MFASLKKLALRWALSNTGKAVAATLEYSADRASNSRRIASITSWSQHAAALIAEYSSAIRDGKITAEEKQRVASTAQNLADQLAALLSE